MGLLFVIKLIHGQAWQLGIILFLSGLGYLIWRYAYIKQSEMREDLI
jgi:hypothetical protein